MLEYPRRNSIPDRSRHFFLKPSNKYPATKEVEGLTRKPIINHRLAEITSIIDRLLAASKEGHDVWDDVKLVLLLGV